jgi:acetolactate synthase small subunit
MAGWADVTPNAVMRDLVGDTAGIFQSPEGYAKSQARNIREMTHGVSDPETVKAMKDVASILEKLTEKIEQQSKTPQPVRLVEDVTRTTTPSRSPATRLND